jgi:hypothetical protein
MEPAGDRWWAMGGGVYFLQAIKRVQGMRVVRGRSPRATVSPSRRRGSGGPTKPDRPPPPLSQKAPAGLDASGRS